MEPETGNAQVEQPLPIDIDRRHWIISVGAALSSIYTVEDASAALPVVPHGTKVMKILGGGVSSLV